MIWMTTAYCYYFPFLYQTLWSQNDIKLASDSENQKEKIFLHFTIGIQEIIQVFLVLGKPRTIPSIFLETEANEMKPYIGSVTVRNASTFRVEDDFDNHYPQGCLD